MTFALDAANAVRCTGFDTLAAPISYALTHHRVESKRQRMGRMTWKAGQSPLNTKPWMVARISSQSGIVFYTQHLEVMMPNLIHTSVGMATHHGSFGPTLRPNSSHRSRSNSLDVCRFGAATA